MCNEQLWNGMSFPVIARICTVSWSRSRENGPAPQGGGCVSFRNPQGGGAWGTTGFPKASWVTALEATQCFSLSTFWAPWASQKGFPSSLAFFSVLSQKAKTEHNITETPLGALEVHTGFQLSLQRSRAIWILSGAGLEFMLLECSKPTGWHCELSFSPPITMSPNALFSVFIARAKHFCNSLLSLGTKASFIALLPWEQSIFKCLTSKLQVNDWTQLQWASCNVLHTPVQQKYMCVNISKYELWALHFQRNWLWLYSH